MSYYAGRYSLKRSKQDAIWIPLVAAFLCALAASALAAALVAFVPETVASITGPLLCPNDSATSKLVTVYADDSVSRSKINILKCYNLEGREVTGNGAKFSGLWWGTWMGAAALLGWGISFVNVLRSKRRDDSKRV